MPTRRRCDNAQRCGEWTRHIAIVFAGTLDVRAGRVIDLADENLTK